ncbi:MAG: glycoside hydrolase family 9 protein [Ruminococcus sp.]|nr:glycoside hydrolase family 9 protein [Ruminococcus sp.]
MKELQNIIHRHFEDPKQKKRYLAVLIALSMLVSFMVPLILMEPADSRTGVLICGKIQHTHSEECYLNGSLNCSIQEHLHTDDCYGDVSVLSLGNTAEDGVNANNETTDNIDIPNAGSGVKGDDGKYGSVNANTVKGVTYSPATQKLYTLLFGEPKENKTHWVDENKSLDANLEIANEEFFLGFASDFCAFIENDFEAFDADAEGRVFIGGDLIFNGNPAVGEWNYQVGAGDFGQFIPLTKTDEYENTHNFASGIIGGKVYRLGTLTTGSTYSIADGFEFKLEDGRTPRHISGTDVYYYPDEGAYKSFIIGNIDESRHLDEDAEDLANKDIEYSTNCNHKYYEHDCPYCRGITDMATEVTDHDYLRNVNELAQFYQYDNVEELLDKTFNTVRTRSSSLATMQATSVQSDNGTLVIDASDIGDAKTAYFKLEDWKVNGNNISKVIIIVPDDRMTVGKNTYKGDNETVTDLDLNIIISCDDEEININKVETFVKSYARGSGDGYKISNDGYNYTNNHPVSSNILYNFPNATKVNFLDGCNFNGTVLAPNADVESPEKCPGHLSGALIAKSFYGGLEFGYRPYRGGVDVLGDTAGYEVPVDKFYDSNFVVDENKFLPGAMFAIKDEFGNVVSLFDTTDQTKYVDIPSKIDLSGKTIYKPVVVTTAAATTTCTTTTVVSKTLVAPISVDKEEVEVKLGEEVYFTVNKNFNVDILKTEGIDYSNIEVSNVSEEWNKKWQFKVKTLNNNVDSFKIKVTSTDDETNYKEVTVNITEWNLSIVNEADESAVFGFDDTVKLSTNYPISNQKFYVTKNGVRSEIQNSYNQQQVTYKISEPGNYVFSVGLENNQQLIPVATTAEYQITLSEWELNIINNDTPKLGDTITLSTNPGLSDQKIWVKKDSDENFTEISNNNGSYTYKFENAATYYFKATSGFVEDDKEPVITVNIEPLELYAKVKDENGDFVTKSKYNIGDEIYLSTNINIDNQYFQVVKPDTQTEGINQNSGYFVYTVKQAGEHTFWVKSHTSSITAELPITVDEWLFNTPKLEGNTILLSTNYDIPGQYYQIKDQYGNYGGISNPDANIHEISGPGEYCFRVKSDKWYPNPVIEKTIIVQDTDLNPASTFSLKLNNLRGSAETTNNKIQKLEIIPEEDKDLLSLRFVFPDKDDNKNRSINAIITYSDGSTEKVENQVRADAEISGKHYIDINCPQKEGNKITKVEIVPVSADTPIDYYVATYSAPCTEVSRNVTVNQRAQNDIMHILKSFETNEPNYVSDVYFTVADSEEIKDKDGKVECYVYTDGADHAWYGETEFNFTDKANVKFENINLPGVTKIVIKPKECEALPIIDYTINTLESEAPDTTPKTEHVEEHKYTIEEIKPVEGFFPTNVTYEVTVKETINYESDTDDNGKPKAAHAEITIIKKDKDGTIISDFSSGYALDISFPDTKRKIIKIGDTEFEMTLDENRKVTSISVGEDTITNVSNPIIINNNYYFNPETKMIVPIPTNHITFINTPGMLFKKHDDGKNPVKDVEIALYKADGTPIDENVLKNGNNVQSTHLYNILDGSLGSLDLNTIYYFTETKTNGKYEKPEDIYFKILSKENADNKYEVIYGTKEQVEAGTGKVLDIINNRVIEMENIRIGGVKLKIQKLHYGTNVDTTINGQTVQNGFNENIPLSGAKFDLFAENGTFIGETTTATDENGLTEFVLTDTSPAAYVSKSSSGSYYLKPGVYYLAEKQIPVHSNSNSGDEYANPGRIYFTVDTEENNFAVHSGVRNVKNIGITDKQSAPGGGVFYEVTYNGSTLNNSEGSSTISDIVSFKVYFTNISTLQIYTTAFSDDSDTASKCKDDVLNVNGKEKAVKLYERSFDTAVNFNQIKFQNYGNENFTVERIELYTENGGKYIYSPGSSTETNNVFGLTNEMLNSTINKGGIVDGKNDESIANLVIGNKTQPDVTEVSVNKKWAGDEKFEYLREDIKVRLYYSNTKLNYSAIEASNWGMDGLLPVTQDMFVTTDTETGDTETSEGESDTSATASEVQKSVEVTLNASNKWKYTWTDLPAKVRNENGAIQTSYYYYVREIEGSDRYTPSYSQASDGTHIVTNTLKTVEIPVTKTWNDNYIENITVPPSLYVHLEWRELDENGEGTGEFKPVPGKTLVLTDPWSGKFEGLPVGFEYRFSEPYLQNGWTPTHTQLNEGWSAEDPITKGIKKVVGYDAKTVTEAKLENTVETSSLPIEKAWFGDETDTSSRPEQLKFKVWRTISKPYFDETDAPYDDTHYTDYERLLQHSLYFYDANMCGTDVSENSALAWRSNCHTEDEVPGGYHDAGDHVMFGLPQGYTASMLGWTYYEFFKDNTGAVRPVNDAEKEHLKVILKRFYDFFVNSVHYDENGNITEILVQKGDADIDHVIWCAPESQADRTNEMVWSDKGSDIAAEYAAALAIAYLNFKGDNYFPDADKYLEVAKKLYDFSTKSSIYGNSFYPSGTDADDKAWAAAWLYEATARDSTVTEEKRNEYKSARSSEAGDLQWDNLKLAAAMVYARQENDWSKVTKHIDDNYITQSYYRIHPWGTARFNAIAQTATLIAAKYNPGRKTDYLNWVTGQMSQLLGKNNWKDTIQGDCAGGVISNDNLPVCLITNFSTDDSIYSPQAPHHRAASGWDDHITEYRANCTHNPTEKHQLIGALVGGPAFGSHDDGKQVQMYDYVHNHPLKDHTYIDDLHDYCCNEVSIDYNAGLVGAAAGLYYFTGTGERSTMIEGVEIDKYGLLGKDEYNAFTTYETKVKQLRMAFNTLNVMSAAPAAAPTIYTDTTNNKQYFIAENNQNTNNYFASLSGNYRVIGYQYICSSCTAANNVIIQNSVDNSPITIYVNTPKNIDGYLIPSGGVQFGWWNGSNSCNHIHDGNVVKEMRIYVESVSGEIESTFNFTDAPGNDSNTVTYHNVHSDISFATNEEATWTASVNSQPVDLEANDDNYEFTTSEDGKSLNVKFLVYDSNELVITATSNGENATSVSRKIKANKMVLSLSTSSVNVNQQVEFKVSNISGDGITYEYYYEGDTSPFATATTNTYSYTPTQVSDEKRIYAVVKYGNVELDRTGTQPLTVNPEGTTNQNPFKFRIGGSDSSVQLNVGEYKEITVENNETASYFEGEGDVVKIINNKVIALKAGTVTINAFASDGRKSSNDIIVTVNPRDMQIQNMNNTMNVGDLSNELYVSNIPNDFKASYELVGNTTDYAILEGKKIRALKPYQSEESKLKVKATITGNVENEPVTLEVEVEKEFTINDFTPSIDVGDANGKLTVNTETDLVLSGKPGNTIVTWSIKEGTTVATIDKDNNKIKTNDNTGTITLVATIKAKDYSGDIVAKVVEKTIKVTPVPMSLSLTSASVEIKDQIVITANNVPDGYDVVWTAKNDNVQITPNGNSVTIIGKKVGTSVITATPVSNTANANEPMTVSEDEPQAVSATVEVTNVPQYEDYYFIHKEVINKSLSETTDINVAELIGSNKVGKIVVKFNSNSDAEYNGVIYYGGETTEKSTETKFKFTQKGPQTTKIDITPEVLQNLYIRRDWNDANALIESIYFYGKIDGPTIVNAPVSMTVGEEVILKALGFQEGGVTWSVDNSTYASIDKDGKLTAEEGSAGEEFVTVKITATSKTNESVVKSVEVRIYPKPNELKVNGEDEVTIKYTSSATLTNAAGFDYTKASVKIGDESKTDVLTISNGVVSLTDTYRNLHESVRVTIQLPGTSEYAASNPVTINFVGKVQLSGTTEVPFNYNSRINIDNAIGDVAWTFKGYDEDDGEIKDGETVLYKVYPTTVDGKVTQYKVTDPSDETKIILTLYPDGRFKSGNTKGIVDVIAVDGEDASAPYQIKVSEIPIRPVIPQEGLDEEFVEYIETTGENWSGSLEDLPVYDEKGNIYYYYVEEYAYKNSASEEWTLLEAKDGYIYGKNNSKYIPMSYANNGLDLISLNANSQNVTVGNKMTGKTQGQMPSSGGVGRTTYYFFGGMIMLLSAAGYTCTRRRQSSRRAK